MKNETNSSGGRDVHHRRVPLWALRCARRARDGAVGWVLGRAATAAQTEQVDAVGGLDSAAAAANQKIDEKAPEQKSKAKQYNQRTQNYLKRQMPKERREQTIWRLKKMVRSLLPNVNGC